MHVSRIGFSALKGARHVARDEARLEVEGPVGDRRFALVDRAAGRVLRTIENPSLVAIRAAYDAAAGPGEPDVLELHLPDGTELRAATQDSGEELRAEYWGRSARLHVQDGPHAAVLAHHLGREVVLARTEPGEVVYSGAVTVIGTSELSQLAARAGEPALAHQDARFRSTLTVHAQRGIDDLAPGTLLRVGSATLRVRGPVPRCAVIDRDPVSGARSGEVLKTLAGCRERDGEVWFGLDTDVVTPGPVSVGDPVAVGD